VELNAVTMFNIEQVAIIQNLAPEYPRVEPPPEIIETEEDALLQHLHPMTLLYE
jgi:hypothetical protein